MGGGGGSTSLGTWVGTGVAGATLAVGSGGGGGSGVGSAVGAGVEVSRDSALGGSGDAISTARLSSEGAGVASIEEVAGVLGAPQARVSEASTMTTTNGVVSARLTRAELKARPARSCDPR